MAEKEVEVKYLNEPLGPSDAEGNVDLTAAISNLSEGIQAAIQSGDIIPGQDTVTTKVGKGDEAVTYGRYYLRLMPTTLAGALALVDGVESNFNAEEGSFDRGSSVVKDFFYANDQRSRQNEGNTIRAAVADPVKTMSKAVKGLAAALGITEAEAEARIARMKAEQN